VANLTVTKAGCTNNNKINQIVQVSTTPSFTGTTTNTTSICLGQSATLIGSVTPTPFIANCTPPIAGTTPLPDGSGISYNTCITVDCYASGQTVTSAADIANICMNMEHSYLGDLQIEIVCPNGTIVPLKTYAQGGGGTYLGAAIDNTTGGPGTGAQYCFAMGAATQLVNGPTVSAGSPAGSSIQAGTYAPASSFAGLVGCPLNGNWCIKITDNLAADDGYIFGWDVNFATALPANQSFTPSIVSQTWSGANITSTSGNNAVITPTSTGSKCYTLTAVDNFGCSYTTQRCVTVNPGPYAGVSNTLAVCSSAASTNLFSLLGTGVSTTGTWSGPAPALTGGNLGTFNPASYTAGTYNYTYTVPASGGCPAATAVVSVTIRPNPSITLSPTNPTCGLNNGVIVINNTSSPASGPYVFTSSSGSLSGQTITAVPAGVTTITISNSFGCVATSTVNLVQQPGPTAITTAPTNATCGNNNGSFTFGAPTGGTAPYTYALGAGAFTAVSPSSGLAPGTYSVTVKDANGCTFTKTVSIINIPGPTAIAGTTTQASCNTNNGTFNVTGVTGGTSAYIYSVDGGAFAATTAFSGLAAGTHSISVRDANNCVFTTTFVINTANGPSGFTTNSTNASCGSANGTATVSAVIGGTPTYSFSFDGGAFSTATTTSGLTAGMHTVTVKDANSCTVTATYSVGSNLPPTAAVTSSLHILCNGASTGSLAVTPTGGTAPYTYTLTSPSQTNATGNFTGLPAGSYSITVRDNAGCTATVSATLTQPTVLTATTTSYPVNCFGNATGTVSAGGSGGTAPYTYSWPALGSSTLATTGGAVAGTYTVTIRDANLCVITRTVSVTQPTSLTLTSTLTPATCGNANGSGTVTVAGGTTPYNYNWSNGGATSSLTGAVAGTYSVTVTDFNGCVLTRTVSVTNIPGPTAITGTTTLAGCGLNNGTYNITGVTGGTSAYSFSVDAVSTGSLTTGLAAGAHTVTVKDANNCLFSTTFNVNTANGPTTATVVTTNASCGTANGSATVTSVTGGLAPYQYSFDGGAFGASATVGGLAAGSHTVVVRDVNSCTLAVTYTEFNNSGPTASVTNSVNILCNGGSTGSFTVTPAGGIAPFTYTLSSPFQTNSTGVFSGLPAGSYNVTVKDNSGCTATASVSLIEPSAVTLTVTSMPANCFGTATGTVSASGAGGTGTLTYLWPALGNSTLSTINNVAAGTYSVTQTDANGCSLTQSVTVTQPTSLTLTSTLTPATCGNANGSGSVTVNGGTPAYSYNWSNGGISSVLTGASAGTYTLNVTDFKGCVLTRTLSITNIPGPTAITGTTTLAGCGLSNGTYNITGVTGGTSAYSFSVDAVATVSLTSGLAAGAHNVSVSDANGCVFSSTFNIGTTAGPSTAAISSSNASCGTANGSATVTVVTGGTAAFQYSFNGGPFAATASTSGLLAGTHTVTILDANSCSVTVTYAVQNNGTPTASILTTTNTTCFGNSTGGFTASGSAGSGAPYSYTLTAPYQTSSTGVFAGLPAGLYSVSVSDNAGCVATTTVTITEPAIVTLTATSVSVRCFGTSTGTINLFSGGGTGAYTYSLNGGSPQGGSTYSSVAAGSYIMAVKDANGCTATQTVVVSEPPALTANVSTQNANCSSANGVASATVSGGTPGYTYSWTGGGGSSDVTVGLVGGSYTLTATDANGCVVTSPAVIGITPGGTAAITASSNITCFNANNGSLTVGMSGGTAPFNYVWTPGGQTTQVASNLSPGTYSCEVTDFYGCKTTASATLVQPSQLTAIMNSNNVKCFGTNTGTVSAAGTGGTGPYTYLWPTIPSTLSTVSNVGIGTYSCQITDNNNCTITATINVTQPTSITLTSTVTAANCNQANGSATVIASGGAGAYTYTWSSGSNAPTQSGLLAGTYTIQVKDANNCIEVVSATIPNTSGPVISISSQTNVSCFGACDGVATASVNGGVTPYVYSWSNGNVSAIAPNLCAQIYTVSVTDAAGCVASTSVTIIEPPQLTVGIVANNPKCFGATNGSGIASALGGTPAYTYSWSSGGSSSTSSPLGAGTYVLLVTDANGCTATSSMTLTNPPAMAASITATNVSCFGSCNGMAVATTTNAIGTVGYSWIGGPNPILSQNAGSLCAGTYTMLATDQNSCTASSIITITQPPVLTASISSTGSVTCNGGNNGFAVVTAGGGTTGYTYVWSGAAASNGNSSNANNLPAGNYTVTVTDGQNCTVSTNATILEPSPLSTTLTTTNVKCNGICDGTANIAFSGGAGATTFLWQPGLQSGNSVNNLCVGNQTVTITSNGSCQTVLTFTLTEPAPLSAVVSATNSNCGQNNGKACVVVSGGTSPFSSTLWSNGVNALCNNNILAGAYTFTVIDANNCQTTASGLVNDVAGPIVAVVSQTNVTCFGGTNGGATATVNGGVPGYSISWSGSQSSANTTLNPINFGSGLHNITVVDAAGCIGTASVNITEPTQLVSAIGSFTNVSCFGLSDGGAEVLVNGGTSPYAYNWTPGGQTSAVLGNVGANTYTVSVNDANGCISTSQIIISQPQALILAASGFTNISCYGGSNGQISTTIQGGSPGYTYVWNPAQSGNSGVIGSLPVGGYSLTVTDSKACSITANFTIQQPSELTSSYTSSPAKCGNLNGTATVTVVGGTPGYVMNWNTSPAQQGPIATNMAPGNSWQCVITDLNGCSITQTVAVGNAPGPVITSTVVNQPSCFGMSNGDITLNYTSGTSPYSITWSSPLSQTTTSSAFTQSVSGVAQGVYTATLTDANGCVTSTPIQVSQPSPLILIPVVSNPNICYGMSTQISASGQGGGSQVYTYTWMPNTFTGGGPHTVSPTTTTSYTVMVSNSQGCTASPKVLTVVVSPSLSAIGTTSTLCHSGAAFLTPQITSPGNGGSYSYTWTPSAPNASSMTVVGSALTAQTTNTYSVMISDGCTIPNATAVFTVITNPLPSVTFTASTLEACAPANIDFVATPGSAGNYTYSWISDNKDLMGTTNPLTYNYTVADTFDVKLTITDATTGCSSTLIKNNYILINKAPIASFYADPSSTSILDPNINFVNTSQGAVSYMWDFGDPVAINGSNTSIAVNPSHYYSQVGEYAINLKATSSKGCIDIARVIIEIKPDFALYIPNAFTPDENGKNDIFQPMGVGINEDNYRMDIFDRWGENIFTSNDFRKGWDGSVKGGSKMAPQGVYIYKIQVVDMQGAKHPYVGHVTVIRRTE
jgi:gliding motility-associated-like protein